MKKKYRKLILLAAAAAMVTACGLRKTAPEPEAEAESLTEHTKTEPPMAVFPSKTEPQEDLIPTAPVETGWEEGYDWEKTAVIGTDIHYLSRELTDYGSGFQYMVEHGDGKMMTYIESIADAFFEEVIEKNPDVLILTGDLSFNGEKLSHTELAEKLYSVEKQGITVLVLPGNHDANNPLAAEFRKEDRLPAERTTPVQFREIYQDFGFNEAISTDENSLSYLFLIDEYNWIMMLDSCLFYPQTHEGGGIHQETFKWIEEQLERAWDEGINVIVAAHHNLLDQSEIYAFHCTIENNEELRGLLGEWGVNLFLSGHLHVQHNLGDDQQGTYEIVTSSLSTPQCQYGVLTFRDDSSFSYHTEKLDMETWARKHGRKEEDLLHFDAFKDPFLRLVFYNQSYDVLSKIPELHETEAALMSQLYSLLKYHYYQGTAYTVIEEVRNDMAYRLWEDYFNITAPADYMQYMILDGVRDYNVLEAD